MIATGGTVGSVEWIIDGTHLLFRLYFLCRGLLLNLIFQKFEFLGFFTLLLINEVP